jgi:hypothetical protein
MRNGSANRSGRGGVSGSITSNPSVVLVTAPIAPIPLPTPASSENSNSDGKANTELERQFAEKLATKDKELADLKGHLAELQAQLATLLGIQTEKVATALISNTTLSVDRAFVGELVMGSDLPSPMSSNNRGGSPEQVVSTNATNINNNKASSEDITAPLVAQSVATSSSDGKQQATQQATTLEELEVKLCKVVMSCDNSVSSGILSYYHRHHYQLTSQQNQRQQQW